MRLARILALLLVATPALAVKEYYATSRSIRALGMGGAFYGRSDDDYALFYNPAGLALNRQGRFNLLDIRLQMAPSVLDAVKDLTDSANTKVDQIVSKLTKYQGVPLYGGVGVGLLSYSRENFALGIMPADLKMNFALLGRDFDTQVDLTVISDSGVFLGYGRSFMDDALAVGITVKGMVRAGGKKTYTLLEIAQSQNFDIDPQKLGGVGVGADADIGAIYRLPLPQVGPLLRTSVGVSLNNLLATKFDLTSITGGAVPGLVRMFSLGGHAVLQGWEWVDNVHVMLDFAEFSLGGQTDPDFGARTGSFFKHVNLGVEAPILGFFVPRVGIHQGHMTAGFGLDLRVFKFDFATYAEELSSGINRLPSRRYALRIQIGWGAAPPAPILPKDAVPSDKKKKDETPKETEQTIDEKPQDAKPTDGKPGDKPAEGKPGDGKAVEEKKPAPVEDPTKPKPVPADGVIQLEDGPKTAPVPEPTAPPAPQGKFNAPSGARNARNGMRLRSGRPAIEAKPGDRFNVDALRESP